MPKFVNTYNCRSVLFAFDSTVVNRRRFYLPNLPFLHSKTTYALTIASPTEMPNAFTWGGREYQYMTTDQIRSLYFTLKDTKRNDILRDAVPVDYFQAANNGQVREFTGHNIFLNSSYIVTTNASLFPTLDDALILKFWYK